ncbi:hypothetical protein DFH06DRAFT_1097696 [Mycena polygramma]|nr:hypothetical protein DFH06DRAFT_1097696 [Mycena polygramma]
MPNQIDGLWFPNDSVVLRAGESVFRVPKSILGARSSVFQAMFEFPQPAASDGDMTHVDEVMDGGPVVRLHDDPTEMEAFLRAIFDSSYFMPPPAEIYFRKVLGILRLSHKYDVGYLHKRALCHLETVYPTQLIVGVGEVESEALDYLGTGPFLDLVAIPVLHEVGASWLLPYAYYSLATYSPTKLFLVGDAWDKLPSSMKQTCLLAQAIQMKSSNSIFDALHQSSTCASPDGCDLNKYRNLCPREHSISMRDPLYVPGFDLDALQSEVCRTCSKQLQVRFDAARVSFWNQLPANCGMDDWQTLLEKREVALA